LNIIVRFLSLTNIEGEIKGNLPSKVAICKQELNKPAIFKELLNTLRKKEFNDTNFEYLLVIIYVQILSVFPKILPGMQNI
jgi:hypothetical protein